MKICILDGYTLNPGDLNWTAMETLGAVEIHPRMKAIEVVEKAADAEAILTSKVPIGRDIMDLLTRLKYIGVLATGYNNIDVKYARQLEIPVTNIPGYSRDSVAQSVFAFILRIANEVDDYNRSVKNGDWETAPDFAYYRSIPMELVGKTLGIVGYGDIGRRVGELARAFGMKVLVSSKPGGSLSAWAARDAEAGLVTCMSIEELFAASNFISLHVPLSGATEKMVNEELLSRCRKGTVLINSARGPVIDRVAVQDALEDGILSWYAADVYIEEPPRAGESLIHHPRTIFTPHIAWASREARARGISIAVENLASWMKGEPVNVVNGVTRGR